MWPGSKKGELNLHLRFLNVATERDNCLLLSRSAFPPCWPVTGAGKGGLFKSSCQVTVMTQEADTDEHQCPQQTPTDTH